ncbi:hypothetical protein [Halomonas rhizosphaerae]|uniref:Rap1a immunity protein domain-containing protein n=1 Tax=Halomonas rhizosphaerae TaxID=3043296 RepID=A0ABT6UXA0_9GAMM|nr:hypothetical protein [Halomonas rhizosphaerae]MDI5890595.1 hypothetical protein [Halomonas rhizosphaerae]
MRKWIAVLAFVPAISWGSDCYSVTAWDWFADMADTAERAKESGLEESEALQGFSDSPTPIRAAWIRAVGLYYNETAMGLSSVVAAMQNACAREDKANMPR